MTTVFREEKTCAICGVESEHTGISSTNSFGSPDLDLRPPEMRRSTMAQWVQECPGCGYAYRSIEEIVMEADKAIVSDAYRAIAAGPLHGSLMGRFLKASIIAERASDPEAAANYALWAAWAADDAGDREGAMLHRNRAVGFFKNYLNDIDNNSEQSILTRTRVVDILRRAKRSSEATDLAKSLLKMDLDLTIRAVLRFQASVASQNDSMGHTVASANNYK
jgi:hypothetical protein